MTAATRPPTGLQALVLLLPSVAALAFKAIVPLFCVCALAMLIGGWRAGWRPRVAPEPVRWLFALLAWAGVASLWSYQPVDGLGIWVRNGTLIAAGCALSDMLGRSDGEGEVPLRRWLALGCVLGAGLMGLEIVGDHVLYRTVTGYAGEIVPHGDSRLNRGAMALAILVFFIGALAKPANDARDRALGLTAVAASILAIAIAPSGAARTGLAIGVPAYALARTAPGVLRRAAGLAAAGAILLMPVLAALAARLGERVPVTLPMSARHRLQIWDFTAARIAERPIFGWGFGSSRDIPNFGVAPFDPGFDDVIPMHPHNGVLEIWLELGALGAVLAAALALAVARVLRDQPARMQPESYAATLTAFWILATAYGLWQEHWIATLIALSLVVQAIARHARACQGAGTSPCFIW